MRLGRVVCEALPPSLREAVFKHTQTKVAGKNRQSIGNVFNMWVLEVSEVVKQADPANQVLFGGLDHAWETGQYLEPVYDALDQDWESARPFDILAVHPYFVVRENQIILDPNVYLWEAADPSRTTLDKYLAYMASRGHGEADIWITEIGWNSALDNPAIENCPGIRPWCVTRAQQAQYLRDSFDILFTQVRDPEGNRDRVKAIVWYQYHDTASTLGQLAAKLSIPLETLQGDPQTVCPADWGLVDGNREPKPAYWAYLRRWVVYVPAVMSGEPGGGEGGGDLGGHTSPSAPSQEPSLPALPWRR